MERLVYNPKVECLIMLEDETRQIDVTPDIVSGTINRRLNAMSDMSLTLQNKDGRYTKTDLIQPMDRIIVRMCRVGQPFLTFSGFVDDAPYYQIYPGTVTLAASDTLKLLANTYFDPGLVALQMWFQSKGWTYDAAAGTLLKFSNGGGVGNDDLFGNMGDLIQSMLMEIANWPKDSIAIYNIPITFIQSIANVLQDVNADAEQTYKESVILLDKLYGSTSSNLQSTGGGTITSPGASTGGGNISGNDVAKLALNAGFSGDSAVKAVAISNAESSFVTNAMNFNSDGSYDVGLWQINTVHTSGGTGLTAPPGGVGTLKMPEDWYAVKPSLPSSVAAYIESMFVPATNAGAAFSISSSGTSFSPWSTFNNGDYLSHMSDAAGFVQGGASSLSAGTLGQLAKNSNDTTQATTNQAQTTTIADNIVKIAEGEASKGIREIGDTNSGPEIQKYQAVTGAFGEAWCASFVQWVYKTAGRPLTETGYTAGVGSMQATAASKNWDIGSPRPGDIVMWSDDHTGIVTGVQGNQFWTVEGNSSDGVNARGPYTIGVATPDVDGAVPTFAHPSGIGSSAANYVGTDANTTGVGGNQDLSTLTVAQIAQLGNQGAFYTQQFQSSDVLLSQSLTGARALANDQPILEWIDTAVQSSGRVYCTTPSGKFLAFFPDRWGFFERTPYFHINDIEIIDLTINKNDTNLTTHVFTSGPILPASGITIIDRMRSMVASIEDEAFPFFVPTSKPLNALDFLKRYGARPFVNDIQNINNPFLLWMHGWMKFIELWSQRFTSSASFTFMPEILPGGLVSFGNRVQMFVESVTHNFDLSGGFTTNAELSSLTALQGTNQFPDLTAPALEGGFGVQTT